MANNGDLDGDAVLDESGAVDVPTTVRQRDMGNRK